METNPRPRPIQPSGATTTLIAPGTVVEGQIKGTGDVRIEGALIGKLDCTASVHVAEAGKVEAELHAEAVSIAGKVNGNIEGTSKIELGPTAVVEGDITSPRILIREGATFEGQVFMTGKSSSKPPVKLKKDDKPKKEETDEKTDTPDKDEKTEKDDKDDKNEKADNADKPSEPEKNG